MLLRAALLKGGRPTVQVPTCFRAGPLCEVRGFVLQESIKQAGLVLWTPTPISST